MPVGFKNSTDGNIKVALNANQLSTHNFLGINQKGKVYFFKTKAPTVMLFYEAVTVKAYFDAVNETCGRKIQKDSNLPPRVVIDCSHKIQIKDLITDCGFEKGYSTNLG